MFILFIDNGMNFVLGKLDGNVVDVFTAVITGFTARVVIFIVQIIDMPPSSMGIKILLSLMVIPPSRRAIHIGKSGKGNPCHCSGSSQNLLFCNLHCACK